MWLDIPLDVQGATVETEQLVHFRLDNDFPIGTADHRVLADSPRAGCRGGRLPASHSIAACSAAPCQISSVSRKAAQNVLGKIREAKAPLLLSLGRRLNIRMIGYQAFDFAGNACQILVDIDEKELKKPTLRADMPIRADVGDSLSALLESEYVPNAEHAPSVSWCRNLPDRHPAVLPSYHQADAAVSKRHAGLPLFRNQNPSPLSRSAKEVPTVSLELYSCAARAPS